MGCASSSPKDGVDEPKQSSAGGGGGGGGGAPGGDSYDGQEEEDYQPLTAEEVNARIQCCDKSIVYRVSKSLQVRYAYVSQRGYYPEDLYKANQDAFKVIQGFNGDDAQLFLGVFDGHGSDGDQCSYYVRDNIEANLKKAVQSCPKDFDKALKEAFLETNRKMHQTTFDDTMSGTTAIVAFFKGVEITVANVGDSRAIVGEKKGKRVIAYSLSIDQTPYRADERERVKAAGAVVMSCDQLEGIVPFHENWGVNLGEELDNGGDPPRVWAPGKSFPGCAFTRSIGDEVAERIGVTAEPELLNKEMTRDDMFVVVASDGVWEFLTNQSVTDMVLKFEDPLDACRSVVAESYRLWLQYEVRTDDITMICAYLDWDPADGDDTSVSDRRLSRRQSRRGSADNIGIGLDVVSRAGGENRPVRRGLSKEKRQAMMVAEVPGNDDDSDDWKPEKITKTPEEVARIRTSVRANFLFQHLNKDQEQLVFDVMKRVPVKKGEVVIRQGDDGDWFYVVDDGEFVVSLAGKEGKDVEILKYTQAGVCFGDLALMYSKPRAATVTAKTDGVLWAMDRRSFRAILLKSSARSMLKTLRSVEILNSLSVGQLQRLQDMLTEVTYTDGDYIITQGDHSETFYVIKEGRVRVTKKDHPTDQTEPEHELMQLEAGKYFGERALLQSAPRAANVIAVGKVKCLYIAKTAFEEVLGPLQKIINDDRETREKVALKKQLQIEAEGFAKVTIEDFSLHGVPVDFPHGQLVLAKAKKNGKEYTLKSISKKKAFALGVHESVMQEKGLLSSLAKNNRFVPLALATFQDDAYLHTLFKTRIATEMDQLIERGTCSEPTTRFYAASIVLALQHLHDADIVYRNLLPENISIDIDGYVQLMDLRFAVKLNAGPHTDICGLPHYLSPEQVRRRGHSKPADFWQLGILMYEMLVGSAPWITGDPAQDSEVAIYKKITAHEAGKMPLPREEKLSGTLVALLNELLDPAEEQRLGVRSVGVEDLRSHAWFHGFNWDELSGGEMIGPQVGLVEELFVGAEESGNKALLDKTPYSGEDWFTGYDDFLTPRKSS